MESIIERESCQSSRGPRGGENPALVSGHVARALGFFVIFLALAPAARAQVPRFFNAQPIAFDPEIAVVNTGIINDVQATVSADRKYVTMTMRPSNSQLLALREFSFQTNGGQGNGVVNNGANAGANAAAGFVGGVRFAANEADAPAAAVNPPVRLQPGAGRDILTRRGMTPIVSR